MLQCSAARQANGGGGGGVAKGKFKNQQKLFQQLRGQRICTRTDYRHIRMHTQGDMGIARLNKRDTPTSLSGANTEPCNAQTNMKTTSSQGWRWRGLASAQSGNRLGDEGPHLTKVLLAIFGEQRGERRLLHRSRQRVVLAHGHRRPQVDTLKVSCVQGLRGVTGVGISLSCRNRVGVPAFARHFGGGGR